MERGWPDRFSFTGISNVNSGRPPASARRPEWKQQEQAMAGRLKGFTRRPASKALAAHYKQIREIHLRKLFADDPKRGERFTSEAVGIFFDYSKNRITDETLKLLL